MFLGQDSSTGGCFSPSLSLSLSLFFLGPNLQHMEVPRLGVESELQLPAYSIAIAMPELSPVCNPHNSSWKYQIINPLSKARYQTCVLMDTSRILFFMIFIFSIIVDLQCFVSFYCN